MTLTASYIRSDKAAQSRVGDEIVLLHLESGVYFGLDHVGARVWEVLDAPHSLADLCTLVEAEYEVERQQLKADITAFLDSLLAADLIVVANA